MVRATDADWLNQLRNCPTIKKREHFVLPKFKDPAFTIRHFAADVKYQVDGFLEKNRDTVNEQLLEVIHKSKFQFLKEMVGEAANLRGGQRKKTVSCQFRDSLKELIVVLTSTRPHYVRCIKPNDEKERYCFEPKRAIQQLRACGVLETVRISAAGYPSRWSYEDFGKRYRVLYAEGGKMWRTNPKKFADCACQKSIEDDKFALGKTKIFFRTGQVARLERLRQDTLALAALKIQTCWRGFVQRRRYQQLKNNIQIIQAATRAFLAFRRVKYLQMHRAAVCIQANFRGFLCRRSYIQMRTAAVAIQSHFRASLVRQWVNKIRYEQKAIIIQKYCRGWLVRKEQIERKKKITLVQCCVRRWLAKRRLRELRIEAKSVGHLQKLNHGLENKIIELQQKLDRMNGLNSKLKEQCAIGEEKQKVSHAELLIEREQVVSLRSRLAAIEEEHERVTKQRDETSAQNAALEARCNETREELEKAALLHEETLNDMRKDLDNMRKKFDALSEDKSMLEAQRTTELDRLKAAENNLKLMREQLELNASLLDSSSFSRNGSIRSSVNGYDHNNSHLVVFGTEGESLTIGGGGDSKAVSEIQLIFSQQGIINELRESKDRIQRENDRLRDMLESKALVESLDKRKSLAAYEAQKIQELELQNEKLKHDIVRLAREKDQSGAGSMDLAPIIERTMEENDRRREESTGLRALLVSNFERQTASPSISPRPDSGHWSSNGAARSESDTSVNDIDDDLSVDRQIRQLKNQLQMQTRSISDKDQEIDGLHNRIKELLSLAARLSMAPWPHFGHIYMHCVFKRRQALGRFCMLMECDYTVEA
uniref:Myosin motor domain-containing protein n=1 Tax=Steinernema glaseri TaxID=37863 RepID=A0A1I7ZSE3_9BILA